MFETCGLGDPSTYVETMVKTHDGAQDSGQDFVLLSSSGFCTEMLDITMQVAARTLRSA